MRLRIFPKTEIVRGLTAGFPVFIGYLPVAVTFGIIAKTTGISFGQCVSFSVFVFAGASQFMALNLLKLHVAVGEIIFATLLMNIRHFLMSASIATRIKQPQTHCLPFIAFGITDETFAVAATQTSPLTCSFLFALEFTAYSAWVGGTALGYGVGLLLPSMLQISLGVALYALFAAILVPHIRKSVFVAILSLGAAGIHAGLAILHLLPSGWNLIASIIVAAMLGAWLFEGKGAMT